MSTAAEMRDAAQAVVFASSSVAAAEAAFNTIENQIRAGLEAEQTALTEAQEAFNTALATARNSNPAWASAQAALAVAQDSRNAAANVLFGMQFDGT